MRPTSLSTYSWLMRMGVAGTFAGHGLLALTHPPVKWLTYLAFWGFASGQARQVLPWIGGLDIAVALLALLWPHRLVFVWATCWAFAAALMRPLVGESWLELVERSANFVLPLAVLLTCQRESCGSSSSSKKAKSYFKN